MVMSARRENKQDKGVESDGPGVLSRIKGSGNLLS